jgi:hypothetical protein
VIEDGVTGVGQHIFRGHTALKNITIPNSVTSIGGYAFLNCALTSISIPEGVTSIGGYAFSGCKGLANVIIPDGVTTIYMEAFGYCTGLTSVTIGDGVKTIGDGAFGGCPGLTSVTIMATTPPKLGSGYNYNSPNFSAGGDTLYVPKGCVAAYQAASAWSNAFTYIVEQP